MTGHFNTKQFTTRYLAWDEENRLMGVADNNQASFYLYDAAGERTVKFTGHNQWVDVNGIPQGYAGADKLTLYASPYLVASSGQYTKHYYAGEQRILSKIGGGGLGNYNAGIIAPETHRKKVAILENMVRFIGNTLYLKTLSVKPKPSVPCNQEGMLVDLCNYRNIVHPEEDRYFYHPDYLGSSSWITDRDGMPMQHLAYLPFGEEFVDQKTSNWSAAYKFSGKEKDEETGYNYFHARYYSSDVSIFLSVDPLSGKYPSISSYAYCNNNPIILIDPDGRNFTDPPLLFLLKSEGFDNSVSKTKTDDGSIHIFSHGSYRGISPAREGIKKIDAIRSKKAFEAFLNEYSEMWRNRTDDQEITIILHSCNTGRKGSKGEASFAERMSKEMKGVTIIAPTEKIYFGDNGEIGSYQGKYIDENGYTKRGKSNERSNKKGDWIIYRGGKEQARYQGNWTPKKDPTFFDKIYYKKSSEEN